MNIINAILNLVNTASTAVADVTGGNNRANNMGEGLEAYIKDLFAGTFNDTKAERVRKQAQVFSYLGSKNYSPDAMLRGGDAIEVKKIESVSADIALNSSHPKHKIYRNDPRVSTDCKNANGDNTWQERDIIYAVGYVPKNTSNLRLLAMVYGTEYCASPEIYDNIFDTVKNKIGEIPDFDFSETDELAHMNGVDPLERTYWRARSMWGIENPWKAFDYEYDRNKTFSMMCIISVAKWNTLGNTAELEALARRDARVKITDTEVQNPDNGADLIPAKLITFDC